MPTDRAAESRGSQRSLPSPSDVFLIASMLGGDAAALSKLMDRYDRLVRYTVFRASTDRCLQDPEWLDSMASATWEGFVRTMRRDPNNRPRSLRAYLARIARNQVVSALRGMRSGGEVLEIDADDDKVVITSELEEPIETLSRLELLEALRACLSELSPEDRTLATQLEAITERRWKDAAAALGLAESTLRSRWQSILERLRGCVRRKTGGESFARSDFAGDR